MTTLNFMALKLQLWRYLFCYYFLYCAQLPHFHYGTEIHHPADTWRLTSCCAKHSRIEYLPNKL